MPNWGGGASGALSGAALGSSFGPIGTGVGAAAGGLIGLFKKKPKPITQNSESIAPVNNTQLADNTPNLWNNYNDAVTRQTGDYGNIMKGYQEFRPGEIKPFTPVNAPTISAGNVNYTRSGDLQSAISGYKDFAATGGYTPEGIQDMRARGISPIRSVYANAMQNMNRSRSLQGGYSPNYIAATEKLTRTLPGVLADKVSDVNAGLATQIQQGRLAGLGGLSQASIADSEMAQRALLANQSANLSASTSNAGNILNAAGINNAGVANQNNANLAASGQNLSALSGQSSLYGTTPAQAGMFGNQVLSAEQIANNNANTQRELDIREKSLPSTFDKNLGRIGNIAQIGAGIIAPYMTGGSNNNFFGGGDKNKIPLQSMMGLGI